MRKRLKRMLRGSLQRTLVPPLRASLCQSRHLFDALYAATTGADRLLRTETTHSPEVLAVAEELRERGVACWRGLFAGTELLEQLQAHAVDVTGRVRESFPSDAPEARRVDPPTGLLVDRPDPWLPELDAYATGRLRARWTPAHQGPPSPLEGIWRDERVRGVFEAHQGHPPTSGHVIAERLEPAFYGGRWHIDTYAWQLKAMVLLSDVGPKNGAMRYKAGTHRNASRGKSILLHQFYRHGIRHSYPSGGAVDLIPGEEVLATGQAGDCYFFDSVGLHTATRCTEGVRLTAVLYCDPMNLHGRIWDALSLPGTWD